MTRIPVPKRIGFVTLDLLLGALLNGNRKFAGKLIEQGHAVDFIALRTADQAAVESLPRGAEHVALGAQRVREEPGLIARHCRETRPSVLFVSGYLQGLVSVMGARRANPAPSVVVRAHEMTSHYLAAQTSLIDRHGLKHAMRLAFRPPVRLAAASHAAARDFAQVLGVPPGRVVTLYDPVLGEGRAAAQPWSHPWLDDPSLFTIVALGRVEPEKDYATLVRAFGQLSGHKPEARLLILGEGSERSRLQQMVRALDLDAVAALPGFVQDPFPALERAGVFVSSSVREGLGNAIIEALAAGTPVVASNCPGGPAEILEDGKHGQLVPVGDAEALAAAILRSPSLPFDREAARARAMDFHIDKVWPTFAALAGL